MATLRYRDGTAMKLKLRHGYDPDQPSTMHLGMSETMSAIEAGYQLCRARGIQLLVVSVPPMVRVLAPYISFDRVEDQRSYLPKRVRDEKDFGSRIAELCGRIGCTFVDTSDALQQAFANGNHRIYIPNDEHLDIGGHEVMAQVVAGWLRDNKVSP